MRDGQVVVELERSAATWESSGRDPAWLLNGSRLIDAEALVRTTGFYERLSKTKDFINASRQQENARVYEQEQRREHDLRSPRERQAIAEAHTATLRKRSRVLRTVLAITTVVAVVAAGLGVLSFVQRQMALHQRNAAIALRLNTEADAILTGTRSGGDILAYQNCSPHARLPHPMTAPSSTQLRNAPPHSR